MRFTTTVSLFTIVAVGVIGLGGCSSSPKATSQQEFCALVVAFKTSNDALGDTALANDPVKTKAAVKQVLGQVQNLQTRAPADTQVDVDTIAEYVSGFDSLLASFNYDLAAAQADPAALAKFQELNTDEVNSARARMGAYSTTECGATATTGS